MKSTWNGPPGQLTRALGKCFHPETKIKLQNGNIVLIKDIKLGDVLESGSRVISTMKIDNSDKYTYEELYKIPHAGVNGDDIYVTGSHLIIDSKTDKIMKVRDYPLAVQQDLIQTEWFSCLITSDNRIQIGKETIFYPD